jgi:hypothetical protein
MGRIGRFFPLRPATLLGLRPSSTPIFLVLTDSVEKVPVEMGKALRTTFARPAVIPFSVAPTSGRGVICAGVQRLMEVGRHAHSRNACGGHVRRRPPDTDRERLEVLRDCGEVELVTSARETSQSHSLEAMMGLEVSKPHLDLLSLIA